MRKIIAGMALAGPFLLLFNSCANQPFACFSTTPDRDSIKVNQPVTFKASCSRNADSYNWEFYDKEDSIDYGHTVTRTFYQPGEVKVFLLVVGNGKTAATEEFIVVHP